MHRCSAVLALVLVHELLVLWAMPASARARTLENGVLENGRCPLRPGPSIEKVAPAAAA